ncbi:hypothetical protein [Streptomyces clavuligerus]|nr:hypothetical protein [Streptomyces clavuligerus]EDY49200.1 hypothetical protein SSCG_02228 [Streptomyces clavuligerus]WDN56115.1 hypothetical protein LL058_30105 [Streptomyces clavuligerus]
MPDPELLERITARRTGLDELHVAEKGPERMSEQPAEEAPRPDHTL